MSLTLSVDLASASFADLSALLHSARAAGVTDDAAVTLDGSIIRVVIDSPSAHPHRPEPSHHPHQPEPPQAPSSPHSSRHDFGDLRDLRDLRGRGSAGPSPVGEAAIRSVIDILTGRQEPPRA